MRWGRRDVADLLGINIVALRVVETMLAGSVFALPRTEVRGRPALRYDYDEDEVVAWADKYWNKENKSIRFPSEVFVNAQPTGLPIPPKFAEKDYEDGSADIVVHVPPVAMGLLRKTATFQGRLPSDILVEALWHSPLGLKSFWH